jgi:hypothetical protein
LQKGRVYLEAYGASFMEQERIFRYRKTTWNEVIRELVMDRGMLLGSSNWEQMTGIEKAEALDKVDTAISNAYGHIAALKIQRDHTIPMRWGFKNRCARVRRRISEMDDDTLGKIKGDSS